MRIGNKIKAGFYPTPIIQVGTYLTQLFQPEETQDKQQLQAWLDPCCGEGEILSFLQEKHAEQGHAIATYGVELDGGRFEAAKQRIDTCVRSAFEQMMISHNHFSLIYLNPPYNHELKANPGEKAELMEVTFLRRAHLYVKEGGIMVYVVPGNRFAMQPVYDFLSKNYEELGLMRFDDEDGAFDQFKQCIFVGRKRAKVKDDTYYNEKFAAFCKHMDNPEFVLKQVSQLSQVVGKKTWTVPCTRRLDKFTFATRVPFKEEFEGIGSSSGILTLKKVLMRGSGGTSELLTEAERVKMPISAGQLGLCLTTGMASGIFGEGDTLHLAQGSEHVYYETTREVLEGSTKETIRQKRRAKFVIALPDGTVKQLV